jgi:antirestriction protein ArdC
MRYGKYNSWRIKREAVQREALNRATTGQTFSNFPAIIEGFKAKGILESEIKPRENVFTFQAWKALGRYVRRGEHGVKVVTVISTERKTGEIDPSTGGEKIEFDRRPWTAPVFHVSQTEVINGASVAPEVQAESGVHHAL